MSTVFVCVVVSGVLRIWISDQNQWVGGYSSFLPFFASSASAVSSRLVSYFLSFLNNCADSKKQNESLNATVLRFELQLGRVTLFEASEINFWQLSARDVPYGHVKLDFNEVIKTTANCNS